MIVLDGLCPFIQLEAYDVCERLIFCVLDPLSILSLSGADVKIRQETKVPFWVRDSHPTHSKPLHRWLAIILLYWWCLSATESRNANSRLATSKIIKKSSKNHQKIIKNPVSSELLSFFLHFWHLGGWFQELGYSLAIITGHPARLWDGFFGNMACLHELGIFGKWSPLVAEAPFTIGFNGDLMGFSGI